MQFSFSDGENSYHVMEDTWREVFGLSLFSNYSTFYDYYFHTNFDLRGYLNSCLKSPSAEDNLAKMSNGYLKKNPRILHWIVTHVLCPRKGGHSRIDIANVHLMYLLQHKVHINWPNYFVSRMFAIKECTRGYSLCYASMIAKFLKHFCIGVSNLHNISLGQAQEFNMSIMKHMGYHWDEDLKVYYYKMKGSCKIIYNYDDSTKFGIDERQVEEQALDIDANMVDTQLDNDNAW